MSTHPIHQSNPFSILNPDTPISTTSRIPTPPPHFSCRTRQPKRSTPHSPTTFSPTPSSSSVPQISISSSPPYKRTFVSQSSIPNSPSETLEDIRNFLKMTQGNTPLPHPPPVPLFLLLLHLKYLQIFILLLPKFPPPPFLLHPPNIPHPLYHLNTHTNPLYHNSVLLQTPPLQTFFLVLHHLPQSPFLNPWILLLLL